MSEREIQRATVLRDMEDELELSKQDLIKSIENVLEWFEKEEQAKQQRKERLLSYFSYSMLIIWIIIMGVLVVLFL